MRNWRRDAIELSVEDEVYIADDVCLLGGHALLAARDVGSALLRTILVVLYFIGPIAYSTLLTGVRRRFAKVMVRAADGRWVLLDGELTGRVDLEAGHAILDWSS